MKTGPKLDKYRRPVVEGREYMTPENRLPLWLLCFLQGHIPVCERPIIEPPKAYCLRCGKTVMWSFEMLDIARPAYDARKYSHQPLALPKKGGSFMKQLFWIFYWSIAWLFSAEALVAGLHHDWIGAIGMATVSVVLFWLRSDFKKAV